MTNTEMWLDETISHIKSVKSDIWMLHEIMSLPNCNDCKNKDCEYKPKWGEHIRYNCPLHNADRKTEPTVSKMEQVETMSCAECKHRPIGAEICEEPCHYEPQFDWHYDEQDATWYPYKHEDEPQTCSVSGRPYSECADCEHFRCTADEPQTERSEK